MADDALQLVKLRNNFYRDNYRRVVMVLLVMVVINIILCGVIFYQLNSRQEPRYFATTADGRVIALYPLSEPVVTKSSLLDWASQAVIATFNFDYVNYRKKLQEASSYYTPSGWRAFEAELQSTKNLDTVRAQKLIASAVVTGQPVIVDERVINGRYAWRIQMPILITYESSSQSYQQPVTITLVVTRVSTLQTPKGIAIAQLIGAERPLNTKQ